MRLLLTLALVWIVADAKPQSVLPPQGSTWTYYWTAHNGGYQGPKTLYYTGDTTVSGQTFKKIASAWNYTIVGPYPPNIGSGCCNYLLERNDSVFDIGVGFTGYQQLLYAFNQNPGDSIVYNAGSGLQYKIVFDSMRTQNYCAQPRRILYYTKVENGCTDSVRIIEGIGPVNDYLFSQGIEACELGPGIYAFTCAEITNCVYPTSSCSTVPLKVAYMLAEPVYTLKTAGRNFSFLFTEPISGRILVTSYTGALVDSRWINSETGCTIQAPGNGIYIVRFISEKGTIIRKIACVD